MRLGQRRVALQRMLMMEAAGMEVCEASRAFCHATRMRLPLRELDRMQRAAQSWACMLGRRGALGWFEDADPALDRRAGQPPLHGPSGRPPGPEA